MAGGRACVGFTSPSRKQEIFSSTMIDWGWPEHATPGYVKSHVHPENIDPAKNEMVLAPTFRLPTLIHSRSGNAKWLAEISNRNPVWIHTSDARRLGVADGDLVRVTTEIGYFVDRVWVTESIKPGIVACSHHLGRWRRSQDPVANRWAMNLVDIKEVDGIWRMRVVGDIEPTRSSDPDTSRIFWQDGGVHQNLTFPVQPDPISGMHCWHQKVRVDKARADDRYGDVEVDTNKSYAVYQRWLAMTRPAPGPGGLRRPLWLNRPLRPVEEMFYLNKPSFSSAGLP
jgi:anaerobic selenocysteine-containing dehydrogenase